VVGKIEMDVETEFVDVDWIYLSQWRAVVNTALNIRLP
jgi:hypothetical protein